MMTVSKLWNLLLLAMPLCTLVASPAQAEDWFFIAESDTGIKIFLDRDSIKRQGKLSEVKIFEVKHKSEEDGTVASIFQQEYSCQEKKTRFKQGSTLFADGSMGVFKEISAWESVKADSINALILQKVCSPQ